MVKKTRRFKPTTLIEGPGGERVAGHKRKRPEETKVHRPVVSLLRTIESYTRQVLTIHVPNQLLNQSKYRKIYYGLGVRAGVSDLIIPIKGGITLYVELKYNGQPLSEDQIKFIADMTFLGHGPNIYVIDAKDPADAEAQLKAILAKYDITDFRLIDGIWGPQL
jgi:hypothetical protein